MQGKEKRRIVQTCYGMVNVKVNVDGMAPPRVVGRDAAENFYLQVTYRLMQMESPLE